MSSERRTDGCCGNDRGGAREETRDGAEGSPVVKRTMRARKAHSLIGQVYDRRNLRLAWERVKKNKGAGGVDGVTIARFDENLEHYLDVLHRQLKDGRYRPRPVKRVEIDKPGTTKKRPLGIPTVMEGRRVPPGTGSGSSRRGRPRRAYPARHDARGWRSSPARMPPDVRRPTHPSAPAPPRSPPDSSQTTPKRGTSRTVRGAMRAAGGGDGAEAVWLKAIASICQRVLAMDLRRESRADVIRGLGVRPTPGYTGAHNRIRAAPSAPMFWKTGWRPGLSCLRATATGGPRASSAWLRRSRRGTPLHTPFTRRSPQVARHRSARICRPSTRPDRYVSLGDSGMSLSRSEWGLEASRSTHRADPIWRCAFSRSRGNGWGNGDPGIWASADPR